MKRTLALLAAGAACSALLWFTHPGSARADTTATTTVGDAAEAWYQTPPADPCSSPVGCPPVSLPSPYPAGTLHVGAEATTQTDAAYVQPDLSSIPPGEQAVAGTMTLPLATLNGNGNTNTSAAKIIACLATEEIPDGTAGSTDTPPTTDCKTEAALHAGATSFTLDLTPFLQAWNSGTSEWGIALLADTSSPTPGWQVAFNGRNLAGAVHITSALTLAPVGSAGNDTTDLGATIFGNSSPGSGLSSAAPLSSTPLSEPVPALPGATGATPPRLAQPAALPATAIPPRASPSRLSLAGVNKGFRYPEIFLLPLALAAGMAFVLRLLIADATPKSRTVPKGSTT